MKNILTEALVNSVTNASFICSYTNSAKLRKHVWVAVEIMSLKKCSRCTSIVYVVSLMYKFAKRLIILE